MNPIRRAAAHGRSAYPAGDQVPPDRAAWPPERRPARRVTLRAVPRHLAWPLLFLGLAFAYFHAAWQDPGHLLIGGASDPEQTIWTLGWPFHGLATGPNPWLTDYLDYPAGVNLMWTPTPAAPGLLVTPVVLAWGPVVAYDLLMTLGPALSAWTAAAAIHRLVPSAPAAFLGGLVYGFGPYVMAQELGHLGFVMAWLPPLLLLLLLGLVAALQLYTSSEMLATSALVALVGQAVLLGVALAARVDVRPGLAALARGGAAALATGGLLAAPGLLTMFLGPQVVHGLIQPPDTYVTDVASLVVPDQLQLIAPEPLVRLTRSFTGLEVEWDGYVGLPLLALLVVTAAAWWDRLPVRWAAILAAAVVVLSLGPHPHVLGRVVTQVPLPWALLGRAPVLAQALPSRLMQHFFLLAGLLLACFVANAVLAGRRPAVRAAAGALAGLSLLVLAPMATPWVTPHVDAPFFSGPAARRIPAGSVALVVPWAGPGDPNAMSWQAEAGYRYRMPEGYALHPAPDGEVAFGPPGSATSEVLEAIELGKGPPAPADDLRAAMAGDLARWRVRTVVVGPMPHEDEAVATLAWLLGRQPERVDGVWVWWDVQQA
ncbi:MAG: hypothetical protein E6J41_32745 [Chloroflexi bacterium]|nr:MAG: hypothetical protein E6J41_32745 [Chloroflexota bacterium]